MLDVHGVVGGVGVLVLVAVVGTQQRPSPGPHVVGRQSPPKLRGQAFRVYELVKAVQVVTMKKDL